MLIIIYILTVVSLVLILKIKDQQMQYNRLEDEGQAAIQDLTEYIADLNEIIDGQNEAKEIAEIDVLVRAIDESLAQVEANTSLTFKQPLKDLDV